MRVFVLKCSNNPFFSYCGVFSLTLHDFTLCCWEWACVYVYSFSVSSNDLDTWKGLSFSRCWPLLSSTRGRLYLKSLMWLNVKFFWEFFFAAGILAEAAFSTYYRALLLTNIWQGLSFATLYTLVRTKLFFNEQRLVTQTEIWTHHD